MRWCRRYTGPCSGCGAPFCATGDLYAQVAVLRTKVITIFAFVGLVVALLSVFVATNITRPLAELTRGAQAIAKGDLEQRVDIRLTDEIGDLAASFNLMAKRLAEEDACGVPLSPTLRMNCAPRSVPSKRWRNHCWLRLILPKLSIGNYWPTSSVRSTG